MITILRPTTGDVPPHLVGASITHHNHVVYVFGGRLPSTQTVVNSLYALRLGTLTWTRLWPPESTSAGTEAPSPLARYFHVAAAFDDQIVFFGGQGYPAGGGERRLEAFNDVFASVSAVFGSKLFIIGGQEDPSSGSGGTGVRGKYVHELVVLDLKTREWIAKEEWKPSSGVYRTLAAVGTYDVVEGRRDGELRRLSYSVGAKEAGGEAIILFSNSNFKSSIDVHRSLDFIVPTSASTSSMHFPPPYRIPPSLSHPPALRFPSGAVIGHFLVVWGIHIAASSSEEVTSSRQSGLSVWALNLASEQMADWREIRPGQGVESGSWTAGVRTGNALVCFGDPRGDLEKEYARRANSFSHVAFIDLETHGVYQPPLQQLSIEEQDIALSIFHSSPPSTLSLTVLSRNGTRFDISRAILRNAWPWLCERLDSLVTSDADTSPLQPPLSTNETLVITPASTDTIQISLHQVQLPLSAPATLALLQHLHTRTLSTRTQLSLTVLEELIPFSRSKEGFKHLRSVAVHALHGGLEEGVYDAEQVVRIARVNRLQALYVRVNIMIQLASLRFPHQHHVTHPHVEQAKATAPAASLRLHHHKGPPQAVNSARLRHPPSMPTKTADQAFRDLTTGYAAACAKWQQLLPMLTVSPSAFEATLAHMRAIMGMMSPLENAGIPQGLVARIRELWAELVGSLTEANKGFTKAQKKYFEKYPVQKSLGRRVDLSGRQQRTYRMEQTF
ncbi:regulatory protein Ral2 [Pseudohyphozyma bogoriensis]|nr:regulatory protein Ral2 [Pseudohyphozyma bogoriensis]